MTFEDLGTNALIFIIIVVIIGVYQEVKSAGKKKAEKKAALEAEALRAQRLIEAKKRRRVAERWTDKEIMNFARKHGVRELGQWFNYYYMLEDSPILKYKVTSSFDDDETFTDIYFLIRKSDGQSISYWQEGWS